MRVCVVCGGSIAYCHCGRLKQSYEGLLIRSTVAEFGEAETRKGQSVESALGGYWPEDGNGYDCERYEVWSRLDVSYEDRIHRRRLIVAEQVDYDWYIVLCRFRRLHMCAHSCM